MLFISHRTADKQAALEFLERARKQGYEERQLFLDTDPDALWIWRLNCCLGIGTS